MEPNFERRLDSIGRIVLPTQLRAALGLQQGDSMAVTCENGRIILCPVRAAEK